MRKTTLSNHFLVVFFIVLLIVQFCYAANSSQRIFAESPSFVRQEIIDDSADWINWKGSSTNKIQLKTQEGKIVEVDKAGNSTDCEIAKNYLLPDIQSVSYVSDGRNLSAIVWLNSQFEEPPSNYTIDTFQEELVIKISNWNLTMKEYTDVNIARLLDPSSRFTIEDDNSSAILSGNRAHEISYTHTRGQNELRVMEMWTVKGDKTYDITYSALPNRYNQYLPIIQKMLDTFEITFPSSREIPTNKAYSDLVENFLTYADSRIRIGYPSDWEVKQSNDNEGTSIQFLSPFEDSKTDMPSWRETTFTMAIDIDSVHDAGTDYRVIYSRVPDDTWTGYWTKQVREISAFDKFRVTEENRNYTGFYEKENPSHIFFSFDLNKVNSPQRYKVVFYITDYFVKNHRFCTLIDTTNWVIIPPPHFDLSANPSSVVLRPGEEKNIQLQLKGNTDLQSEAFLSVSKGNDDGIDLGFFPNNKTSIPPLGSGGYSLIIRADDSAQPRSYTFPIIANVSFPTSITNRGGETFNNNKSVSVIESSNLTLTVLPQYTTQEYLSNFTKDWITPITGIWTFIAGIGTVVGPLILYLYRKRRKKRIGKHQPYEY